MSVVTCPYCKSVSEVQDDPPSSRIPHKNQCSNCSLWFVYQQIPMIYNSSRRADCLNGGDKHNWPDWRKKVDEPNKMVRYCLDCGRMEVSSGKTKTY